jgi:threonine dehydrogenase-like Zn-dependent dehydrogenase
MVAKVEQFSHTLEGRTNVVAAQFVRAPFAEQTTLLLPSGTDHELDYVLLSDVFPTEWTVLDYAGFQPGDTVAIFGARKRYPKFKDSRS